MAVDFDKDKIKEIGDRICLGLYEKGIIGNRYAPLQEASKRIGYSKIQDNYNGSSFKTEVKKLAKDGKVHNDGKGWKVVALSHFGVKYIIQRLEE